jgi:hypothetical protein
MELVFVLLDKVFAEYGFGGGVTGAGVGVAGAGVGVAGVGVTGAGEAGYNPKYNPNPIPNRIKKTTNPFATFLPFIIFIKLNIKKIVSYFS